MVKSIIVMCVVFGVFVVFLFGVYYDVCEDILVEVFDEWFVCI